MGRKLNGWGEVGGSDKANFLDSWKKEGFLKLVLHRDPPSIRSLHNFRKVVQSDDGGEKIVWFPFVCWETEDFHRKRRFEKDDPPAASLCPGCRMLDHLAQREDLESDAVIFSFGSGKGRRDILKDDFSGNGQGRDSWEDDFSPQTDYVISVIPLDDVSKGVCLTNEKWSLGKALRKRIDIDVKTMGDEEGHPGNCPIAYTFEYDSEARKYGVSRFDRAEITDEIRELWEGPAPDASRFINRGNPKMLLEQMRNGEVEGVDLPLDEIFAPALAEWTDKDEGTDFNPAELEAEEEKPKKVAAKPAKKVEKKTEPTPVAKKEEAKPTRSIKAKKPEPEPVVEPDEESSECPSCGADWPMSLKTCPSCGAEAEDEEEPAPPPKPAKVAKSNGREEKRPSKMPWP